MFLCIAIDELWMKIRVYGLTCALVMTASMIENRQLNLGGIARRSWGVPASGSEHRFNGSNRNECKENDRADTHEFGTQN